MKNNLKERISQFFAEVKLIQGAENAILKLSEAADNCIRLSGKIYGDDINDEINALGEKYGLLVLADELTILYANPKK